MATIPTHVTEKQFHQFIEPRLSQAKRGYVSEQPLYKIFNYILYKLSTGCQWEAVPIEQTPDGQPIVSYQVPYYHCRKWSKDGSLQRLFDASMISIHGELPLSELNLDGSHSAAKKGANMSGIKAESKPKPGISYP
jgi:transposase